MSNELTIAHYLNAVADKYGDRPALYFKSAFRTFSLLREILAAHKQEILGYTFPRWAATRLVRILGIPFRAIAFGIPALFSRTTVEGRENLAGLRTPAIFIANHVSYYDPAYVIPALPRHLRKIAAAAAADVLFELKPEYRWKEKLRIRFQGFWAKFLLNAFPMSRGMHVKKSFEYMGELIDYGWNILLFPEGRITLTGEMDHFKGGIGLLAQAMQVPVVPVKLEGLWPIVGGSRFIPKSVGRVRVLFGKALEVDLKADPDEITQQFENALRGLS